MPYQAQYLPAFLGWATLRKWAVNAGATNENTIAGGATDTSIGYVQILPFNLLGYSYPSVNNASGYPSQYVQGKKRPGFTIRANAKKSWFTRAFLNGLILSLDANSQSDRYSLCVYNTAVKRIFDWARCTNVRISGSAAGGTLAVEMGFNCRWGESETPTAAVSTPDETTPVLSTFATQAAGYDAGQSYGCNDWDFGIAAPTAQGVRSFVLNIIRGQGYVDYANGVTYPREIASGVLSGSLSMDMNPGNPATANIPTNSATLCIRESRYSGTDWKAVMALNRDSFDQPEDSGISNGTFHYTLIDKTSGGCPVALSDNGV